MEPEFPNPREPITPGSIEARAAALREGGAYEDPGGDDDSPTLPPPRASVAQAPVLQKQGLPADFHAKLAQAQAPTPPTPVIPIVPAPPRGPRRRSILDEPYEPQPSAAPISPAATPSAAGAPGSPLREPSDAEVEQEIQRLLQIVEDEQATAGGIASESTPAPAGVPTVSRSHAAEASPRPSPGAAMVPDAPPAPLDHERTLEQLKEKGAQTVEKEAESRKGRHRRAQLSSGTVFLAVLFIVWLVCSGALKRGWLPAPRMLQPLVPWMAVVFCGFFYFLASRIFAPATQVTAVILGLTWDRNTFCRGWFVTGDTGTGKTAGAVMWILHTLFQRESGTKEVAPWGGLFVDEKGSFSPKVVMIGKTYGREDSVRLIQSRPRGAAADWRPQQTINLLDDDEIPANTFAELIVGTATAQEGEEGGNGVFFKTQAQVNIGWMIQLTRLVGRVQKSVNWTGRRSIPTLESIFPLLTSLDSFNEAMVAFGVKGEKARPAQPAARDEYERATRNAPQPAEKAAANKKAVQLTDGALLTDRSASPKDIARLREALQHFERRYWSLPADTLGSIQGNVTNYLSYFQHEEIRELVCAENPTVRVSDVDRGVLLCLMMPQKFRKERRYICTILKFLFYTHALRRFDLSEEERGKCNLLVLFQDEAQRFAIAEDGNVDVLREALTTTVMASQQTDSMFEPLGGEKKAMVILGNLRNRVHLASSTEECAEATSKFMGKEKYQKKSRSTGRGGTSTSSSEEIRPKVHALEMQNLRTFEVVLHHADRKIKRGVIPVLGTDGLISQRFIQHQLKNAPIRGARFWLKDRWLRVKGTLYRCTYSFTGAKIQVAKRGRK